MYEELMGKNCIFDELIGKNIPGKKIIAWNKSKKTD
jgi:hypothetical protein